MEKHVSSVAELLAAAEDGQVRFIIVTADIEEVPTLTLSAGQTLRSLASGRFGLIFLQGVDGVGLTSDNSIISLDLRVSPEKRAVWNDCSVSTLGRIMLRSLNTVGRVQIIARDKVREGRVEVDGLDIQRADSRAEQDRPHEYGVYVLQGAFTLWNMQPNVDVVISADLTNISVGRVDAPVLGSGIFISGGGEDAGRLQVQRLETGAVYSDGRLAPETPDQITGGVFTLYGTQIDSIRNNGPIVTYGANDMALDNWGIVERWIAKEKITTRGPSGIGIVNFGIINDLVVEAPIETFGPGGRGFNVYSGTVNRAEFDRIVTHADGAVGIQIGRPIGELTVRRGVETFGATGPSLVKGVVQNLSAIALSIKQGGSATGIKIDGGLRTHGKGVPPIEQEGMIEELAIKGGFGVSDGGAPSVRRP